MSFLPDFQHFADVMQNKRPSRLPLYEHIVDISIMEKVLDQEFALLIHGNPSDQKQFFKTYCRFFKEMTYDVVSFEVCITEVLPESGALSGGKPGPIQNRADFEAYPWEEIPGKYWERAAFQFETLSHCLPDGMKAVGGVGNGVFELSEDLVGLEYLPFMQADDPELYQDLFIRIGDLMCTIWSEFIKRYKNSYVACRFGDDLGYKSSLLTNPTTVIQHLLPQYRRIIQLIRPLPFLWHSCGNVFSVMEEVINAGISAKHSNEDAIAPFSHWIKEYGDRIALVGGFDLNELCQSTPDEVRELVYKKGKEYRAAQKGYALGSGNSIPDFTPVDNYLAMIEGAKAIRESEGF